MSQEKYIAAIEIGSSKITVAVGRAGTEGRLSIVAVEQERTVECVCHGVIHNVEETAAIVNRLIARIERRTGVAPRKVTRAYVGLSGRSLRNVPREVARNLPEDTEITEEILENLRNDALHSNIDSSLEIIDALPSTFQVNKTDTRSPVGTFGSSIRAHYQLIAARPLLRKHLERVVRDKVGVPIAGIVVTPLGVADLILSPEEKRLGCMLVDLGAETTTVTIYRQGALCYLAVLPMGGRNITTDITTLNVLEERAEEIKTTSGCAIPAENPSTLNLDGVKLSDVSNLVVARCEEIVANIVEQASYAGINDMQLPGGIIAIGGGFNLNRLIELLKNKSNLKVRRGTLPSSVTVEDTKAPTYETIEVAAILNAGNKLTAPDCLEIPRTEELPVNDDYVDNEPQEELPRRKKRRDENDRPQGRTFISNITTRLASWWGDTTDDDDDDSEF